MGELAALHAESTLSALKPVLLRLADDKFSLEDTDRLAEASRVANRDVDSLAGDSKQASKLVHETEGWRGLETMLLALAAVTRSAGASALVKDGDPDVDVLRECLDCVRRASDHPNRFVREAGLKLLDACASASVLAHGLPDDLAGVPPVMQVGRAGLSVLGAGLADNWSQVRYAASLATRTVMTNLEERFREEFYVTLLPRMCLNRHYVAEGVRSYSQGTWRMMFRTGGKDFLTRFLEPVVEFYESQVKADNHAVREAACQSMGELVLRLDMDVIEKWAGRIACAVVNAFKDESWPVRDHACKALSDIISMYPLRVQETGILPAARDLFVTHLSDNIPSVRLNCANGFTEVCLSYPPNDLVMGLNRLETDIRTCLKGIENQKEDSDERVEMGTRAQDTQFGASTRLPGQSHQDDAHTDQVMYSCGSLAPKLRRGGGCTDHGFVRAREGWEHSEGGLLVIGALSKRTEGHDIVKHLLADVFQAGMQGLSKSFRMRNKFMESVLSTMLQVVQRVDVLDGDGDDGFLRMLVLLILKSEKVVGERGKRLSRECRRAALRVGLKQLSEMEESVRCQAEGGIE